MKMLRCMTVRELSLGKPFCQFCHFSSYNSVRFVYISFTLSFFLFSFSFLLKLSPCHFYLAICAARGKSLILKDFFLPSHLPKLATSGAKMLSY